MLETNLFRRALLTGLVSFVFVASACDQGSSDSGTGSAGDTADADLQAGRDNVAAMSREHADDITDPSEAALVAPAQAVDSESLPYADVDNELVYGYLAYPSGVIEPPPAVLMIHEWWGLNDNIKAMANRLAAEGYMVLAIDLYGGQTASNAEEARQRMLQVVENPEPARENLRQALNFLNIAQAPAIGTIGWCFGGGWSLNTAMLFPTEVDASVVFYGQVTADENKLAAIDAPLLGLFGAEDRGIKVDAVRDFEAALQRLRKDHDIHVYPGVGHAFANPTGNNYNEQAAEDAWDRTVAFFAENLKPVPGD